MTRRLSAALIAASMAVCAPNVAAAYYETDTPACDRVARVARQVGWPVRELRELRRIAARESHCKPKAHNKLDPTVYGSRGVMQINGSNVRYLVNVRVIRNADDLFDLTRNLRAALVLWKLYGWQPWAGHSHTP